MTFAWLGIVAEGSGPGAVAASWSLTERTKYLPSGKPTAGRIAEYFEPAVRDGKKLNMMEGNWCAAGACYAASQVVGTDDLEKAGLPHAYRVSGKELEEDAQKHNAWLSAADVLKGARPNIGDLAIYNRGDPQDWTRHVGRIIEIRPGDYTTIDANGPGAAWAVVDKVWNATNLRGFIRYPASSPGVSKGVGLGAGMLIATVGVAFVWAALSVKPGRLAFRGNPIDVDMKQPGKLVFRLSDEQSWASKSFQASTPKALVKGIQRAWDEYIVAHARETTHPGFALSARQMEILKWREERAGRASTAEQRKSWDAQIEHWGWQARHDLGGVGGKLGLHVRSNVSDFWMTTTPGPASAKPPRVVDEMSAAKWLKWAAAWEEHDRNLAGLAGHIGDVVGEEMEKEAKKRHRALFRVVKS